jgi:hypothetical protein
MYSDSNNGRVNSLSESCIRWATPSRMWGNNFKNCSGSNRGGICLGGNGGGNTAAAAMAAGEATMAVVTAATIAAVAEAPKIQ